jgi:hypothetical protein
MLLKLAKLHGTPYIHMLIRELRTTVGNDFQELCVEKVFYYHGSHSQWLLRHKLY